MMCNCFLYETVYTNEYGLLEKLGNFCKQESQYPSPLASGMDPALWYITLYVFLENLKISGRYFLSFLSFPCVVDSLID